MTDTYTVEPDVGFINEVSRLGGGDLKKCFQCATCSVVCPISPDTKPFPRKEMIAASWGLKDRLVGNGDVWLCHNCGDCTTYCPRGAKPGDVLAAVRSYAISEYAPLKTLGKWVNEPAKLPLLLAIPVVLLARFISVGLLLTVLSRFREFSPRLFSIMTWGGLRGGISIALALSLPRGPERDIIIAITYGVVVFSILVQGLTVEKVVQRFFSR